MRKGLQLSEERITEIRVKSKQRILGLSLPFQLGYKVGEVMEPNLPTLSTDIIGSRNMHTVTEEEADELHRLYGEYLRTKVKEDFGLYVKYNKELHKKYYPKVHLHIEQVLYVSEENMDEFKKGLGRALYDSDICPYDLEPENIEVVLDDKTYYTKIALTKLSD